MSERLSCRLIFTVFAILFSTLAFGQMDTNYLYIDSVDIRFSDPDEKLASITFQNGPNHLDFNNLKDCVLIGIRKNKACRLIILTNHSEIRIEDINQYIAYTDAKQRIQFTFPKRKSTCTKVTFTTPNSLYQSNVLLSEAPIDFPESVSCVMMETFPVEPAVLEEFPKEHLLE